MMVGGGLALLAAVGLNGALAGKSQEVLRKAFAEILSGEALVTRVEPTAGNALRVSFSQCPSPVSFIRCEMRLTAPADWDGRLWGLGNGGWAGRVGCSAVGSSATVQSDLGTSRLSIGTNPVDPEILKDFGWRATHLMTVAARRIVRAYYGKDAHHAYFYGESTGGGQGLCEVQRYPEDYDGVIAGVPAFDRSTRATTIWQRNELQKRFGKWFTDAEQAAIRKAELAVFARTDPPEARGKFIWNPHPTPEKLAACWSEIVSECPALADRKELWYAMFEPVVVNGRRLAPGQLLGVEFAYPWTFMLEKRTGPREGGAKMTAEELLAFSEDPDLAFKSADLSAFRARGGKLIVYSGLEDEAIPPRAVAEYHAAVVDRDGPSVDTDGYFAFYEIPGRWHSREGKKDGTLGSIGRPRDLNEKIIAWVERGIPPGTLEVPFVREPNRSIHVAPLAQGE